MFLPSQLERTPCVVDTGGKFAGVNAGVNDAGGKWPPVSTTLAANLPTLSLTQVANNWNNIRLQTPEGELEGKNVYLWFPLLPKGDQIKLFKFF